MNGLVSPEVSAAVSALLDQLQKDQVMTRLLSKLGPDYMVAFPSGAGRAYHHPSRVARPAHHVRTDTQTIIFQQDAYVYETVWPYMTAVKPQTTNSRIRRGNQASGIRYA